MLTSTQNNLASDLVSWAEKDFPAYLPEIRKEALSHFQTLGLPTPKTEEYKHTPITRLLEKNFDFSSPSKFSLTNAPIDPTTFFIHDVEGDVMVLIDGIFSKEHSRITSSPDEVTILSMEEALKNKEEAVLQHITKIADYKTDPFAAWNTATWRDGVFIKVNNNRAVANPIVIYNIHNVQQGQVITSSRNLIVLGKSSEVTVIEKFDSIGSFNGFSSTVTEAIVGENAGLNFYSIQNDQANRYQYGLTQIHQNHSSRVNTYTFTLNGKLVRNNLQLALDGQGIESHMFGLYLIGKDTLADNHTVVDHRQPHSFSNELYKGIMEENAKGVFNGKIFVRPNAQKTNAFQSNRNILLTDKASVNTKPQLEIWADDVKCSHGCTSGQLDEEAMFYLQSRGINKETARAMMLYAFAAELLETIKHPGIKRYVDELISERLHKNF